MTSTPLIDVSSAEIDDLRARLRNTRWAPEWPSQGWQAGVDQRELRRLAGYWESGFDWYAQQQMINALPSYSADIGGVPVHYFRFDAETTGALPLVLTNGWPSTSLELVELARRLATPSRYGDPANDAFTVIVPSLPGFPFSPQRPSHADQTHELWHQLMSQELRFARYGAHGGDLGAGITSRLAQAHPEAVVGIHLLAVAAPSSYDPATLTDEERRYLAEVQTWIGEEGGYQHEQQTRPLTLGAGLTDSPVGLLSWIVEKYRAWSDCGGVLSTRFSDDVLLTQASLYWFTNSIASSFRPYYEYHAGMTTRVHRVDVPTAVALFPADLTRPPRSWAERTYAVTRYTSMPRGGHFAPHEEPELLAGDIGEFFRTLR